MQNDLGGLRNKPFAKSSRSSNKRDLLLRTKTMSASITHGSHEPKSSTIELKPERNPLKPAAQMQLQLASSTYAFFDPKNTTNPHISLINQKQVRSPSQSSLHPQAELN